MQEFRSYGKAGHPQVRVFTKVCLAMVVCVIGNRGIAVAAEPLKVGAKVPEFEMQASDGKTYAAKDIVGQRAMVIAWFPAANTRGCTKECKSMKESGQLLRKFDVAVFTASTDAVDVNAKFAESLELDYPILCDPGGKHAKLFGVLRDNNKANRVTFVISKEGKVLAVIDKVKTETHGEDLAKLLKKLEIAPAKKS